MIKDVNLSQFTAWEYGLAVVVVGLGTWAASYRSGSRARALATRAATKVAQRNAKKHDVLSLECTAEDEKICKFPPEKLQKMMASKALTCEAVVTAFCRKARRDCYVDGLNAITEEFYDEAVTEARKLDKTATAEMWKDARYPLLGLPISVKDCIAQKGADHTMGCASFCFRDTPNGSAKDGLLVQLIREAGGIPFVRSNVPQLLLSIECANNVWGKTLNPVNQGRAPGGSSGGEAALVASYSSPLGMGSDIGGSLRIPALFSGCYGFKPTEHRVVTSGMVPARSEKYDGGRIIFQAAPGPMAMSTEGCAMMMRSLYSQNCFSQCSTVPPIPWDEQTYRTGSRDGGKKKLTIGYFESQGIFEPSASTRRALIEAREALARRGHKLVEMKMTPELDGWRAAPIYFGIKNATGNLDAMVRALEGEPLHFCYSDIYRLANIPNWLRPLIQLVLGAMGEQRKKYMLRNIKDGGISARKLWKIFIDMQAYRDAWLEATSDFDVILCPGFPIPAVGHNQSPKIMITAVYTFFANILQWPIGAVPITRVRENEQEYPLASLPVNQQDSWAKESAKAFEDSVGLPVGVQILARPFCDELCLHAMKELEVALEGQ